MNEYPVASFFPHLPDYWKLRVGALVGEVCTPQSLYTLSPPLLSSPLHLLTGADNRTTELGNFARFANCMFEKNEAKTSGAAFAVATSILFESRELVRPVELWNW